MRKLKYRSCCVDWPQRKVEELHAIIDRAITITWGTFRKHVDAECLAALSRSLGYVPGETLQLHTDWAVSFHRSRHNSRWVYYARHSAIEYFFW